MNNEGGAEETLERRSQGSEAMRDPTNLVYRYGKIGIDSVAAALRFTAGSRERAVRPAQPIDPRFGEQTA